MTIPDELTDAKTEDDCGINDLEESLYPKGLILQQEQAPKIKETPLFSLSQLKQQNLLDMQNMAFAKEMYYAHTTAANPQRNHDRVNTEPDEPLSDKKKDENENVLF